VPTLRTAACTGGGVEVSGDDSCTYLGAGYHTKEARGEPRVSAPSLRSGLLDYIFPLRSSRTPTWSAHKTKFM
jgi:hypothetical protein